MSYPTTAHKGQVDAVQLLQRRNSQRKGSRVGIGKEARKTKMKRRYGTDDRTWTEKNRVWKLLAKWGSYFCQFIFFASASYLCYRVFWDNTVAGYVTTFGGVGFIAFVAYMQYLTSDGFWDEKARGNINISYAFLNFVVIWGAVCAISIGGTFLYGVDTKDDPQLTDHPAVTAIRQDIQANRDKIAEYQAKIDAIDNAPKNDPNVYVQHGADKGAPRHNVQNEKTRHAGAIAALEATNSELATALATQYGVSAEINKGTLAIHAQVENSKIYFRIGIVIIMLIAFEFARWFDSKWNEAWYAEQVLAGNIDDPDYKASLLGKA